MRTEFGAPRTICACQTCQMNCRFIPGYLIPADLDRLIPEGGDPFAWAERNLLASPGATAMKDGKVIQIPTLVPATKPDGSCINLDEQGRCGVHASAPFGCAFFDCKQSKPYGVHLSNQGLTAIMRDTRVGIDGQRGLYTRLWRHLHDRGLVSPPIAVKRERMMASMIASAKRR